MYIFLGKQHMGKVKGLCGNFDDISDNEFKDGKFNAQEFGNSYQTKAYCKAVDKTSLDEYDPCVEHGERSEWAIDQCKQIYGPKFDECRKKINGADTRKYYEACLFDACS